MNILARVLREIEGVLCNVYGIGQIYDASQLGIPARSPGEVRRDAQTLLRGASGVNSLGVDWVHVPCPVSPPPEMDGRRGAVDQAGGVVVKGGFLAIRDHWRERDRAVALELEREEAARKPLALEQWAWKSLEEPNGR